MVKGIEDVKEEFSIYSPSISKIVRHIHPKQDIIRYLRNHLLHRQFIKLWNKNLFQLIYFEDSLFSHKEFLDELLIELIFWR